MIARFVDASRTEQPYWTTRMPLDEAAQVESVTEGAPCPNCAKSLRVHVDTHGQR